MRTNSMERGRAHSSSRKREKKDSVTSASSYLGLSQVDIWTEPITPTPTHTRAHRWPYWGGSLFSLDSVRSGVATPTMPPIHEADAEGQQSTQLDWRCKTGHRAESNSGLRLAGRSGVVEYGPNGSAPGRRSWVTIQHQYHGGARRRLPEPACHGLVSQRMGPSRRCCNLSKRSPESVGEGGSSGYQACTRRMRPATTTQPARIDRSEWAGAVA